MIKVCNTSIIRNIISISAFVDGCDEAVEYGA